MIRSITSLLVAGLLALTGGQPAAWGQFATADPNQSYAGQSYGGTQYPSYSGSQQQAPSQAPQNYGNPENQPYENPQAGQNQAGQNQESDPNLDRQHGVARISMVQGDVNLKRGDDGAPEAAVTNAPLMAQDHLQTGPGSRAEIEFDYGNLMTVGPNTDVRMSDLQYHRYQVQIGIGTVIYRVIRNAGSQAEIDTPSVGIRPENLGAYRVSVFDDGTSEVTVRAGQAEMDSPNGSQQLQPGQSTLIRGTPTDAEFQTVAEIPRDQLDDWTVNRDQQLAASQSYQYVSPDVYGADDLDHYGRWVPSQYGQVWTPQQMPQDWSPYSDGEWTWEDYYGWTWVDAAPWGWAPFHYGRWFMNPGYGWCWWPGGVRSSFWWSPALVGFFGWGGGVGFGVGFGGLGWVALAPFEPFHCWWGHGVWARGGWGGWYGGNHFWGHADIGRMYRNAAFRGGALTAAYNNFGGPHGRFHAATRAQLTNATYFRGQIPVAPTRTSFQLSNRMAVNNPRLAPAMNRQFFQSRQFAAARASGATRFGAPNGRFGVPVANNGNRQFGYGQNGFGANARTNSPASRYETQAQPRYQQPRYETQPQPRYQQPQRNSGGWQRFGDPSGAGSLRQGYTSPNESSGWHSFGQPPATNRYAAPRANPTPAPRGWGGSAGYGGWNAPRYSQPSMPRYQAPAGPRYSAPSMPRYSAPSAPHYSAPPAPHYSTPHYSAPSGGGARGGGGGGHVGGSSHFGGGGGGGHRR